MDERSGLDSNVLRPVFQAKKDCLVANDMKLNVIIIGLIL